MKERLSILPGVVFRSKIRGGTLAIGILLLLASVPPDAHAQIFFYRMTPIADTQPQFPYANFSQFPCQNTESGVAFEATLVGGVQGMFSRHGLGGVDDIVDTGLGEYDSILSDCSINANGVVAFMTQKQTSDRVLTFLLRGGGGNLLQTLLGTDGPYDDFSGFQLNVQGKTVARATKADGSGDVILTKGAGPLSGPEKIIASTGSSSPYAGFETRPSINGLNTVAFTALRHDGASAIFTVADNGTVTQLIDNNTSPFAFFNEIDLNDSGSVAFYGSQWGGLFGVWRIDSTGSSPTVTEITDATRTGSANFTEVSINDSGQVAYSFRDPGDFVSTVSIGDGKRVRPIFGPPSIVAGPGTVALGRTVYSAQIGRDALNNLGQIVLHIDFDDGSQMVARADLVNLFDNLAIEGAFQLATGAGSGTGMGTTVHLPPTLVVLAFDATFLTIQGGLKVQLGNRLLASVPASSPGVRQRIRVPIDLRQKTRSTTPPKAQELKFALAGAPGGVVQIGSISIPGTRLNSSQPNAAAQWHFDTKGGGQAGFVNATRFPIQIKVLKREPGESEKKEQARTATVAILSTANFDATRDIRRDTLNFAGMPVRHGVEAKGGNHPQCTERDVNEDGRADLVCEFRSTASPAGRSVQARNAMLEGMTPYGWLIEGREAARAQ